MAFSGFYDESGFEEQEQEFHDPDDTLHEEYEYNEGEGLFHMLYFNIDREHKYNNQYRIAATHLFRILNEYYENREHAAHLRVHFIYFENSILEYSNPRTKTQVKDLQKTILRAVNRYPSKNQQERRQIKTAIEQKVRELKPLTSFHGRARNLMKARIYDKLFFLFNAALAVFTVFDSKIAPYQNLTISIAKIVETDYSVFYKRFGVYIGEFVRGFNARLVRAGSNIVKLDPAIVEPGQYTSVQQMPVFYQKLFAYLAGRYVGQLATERIDAQIRDLAQVFQQTLANHFVILGEFHEDVDDDITNTRDPALARSAFFDNLTPQIIRDTASALIPDLQHDEWFIQLLLFIFKQEIDQLEGKFHNALAYFGRFDRNTFVRQGSVQRMPDNVISIAITEEYDQMDQLHSKKESEYGLAILDLLQVNSLRT
jgi:hypothetical protein